MLELLVGIEPTTSPLPRECSTTELQKRWGSEKAGNETRTRDIQLGKLTLYQLSYSRVIVVGRGGFEPPYTYVNRFTVCRL